MIDSPIRSIKQVVKNLIGERNLLYMRERKKFLQNTRDGQVIFVHIMGKVGSTSVVQSLNAAGVAAHIPIYTTFFLSKDGRSFMEALRQDGHGPWDRWPMPIKRDNMRHHAIGKLIAGGYLRNKQVKIVTLVREPIATNVSGFFQNWEFWPEDLQQKVRAQSGDYLQELIGRFFEKYPHEVPVTWLDNEVKHNFNIDVFAQPFNVEKGYTIYHGPWADLLLIRLENLNDCAAEAFSKFFGLDSFELINANVASEKWYSPMYKAFKQALVLPETYITRMAGSRYARHFYTNAEIAVFRKRWEKAPVPTSA